MSQPNARALTRNTYSLDTAGVLAHLRDTTRAYAARLAQAPAPRDAARTQLPRARVGPQRQVLEDHAITDAWRIR